MKKILVLILISFFISNISYARQLLKGINEAIILYEDLNPGYEKCKVSLSQIKTTAEYILSNSKIKITSDTDAPISNYIYINTHGAEMGESEICVGQVTVKVIYLDVFGRIDPSKNKNQGNYTFWEETVVVHGGMNKGYYNDQLYESLEDIVKRLVIKWNEDNK